MARSDWKRPNEFSAPEGRRRVALEISYDGRAFNGWQSQNNALSVQDTVAEAAVRLLGDRNIEVVGSSRTDSGVHAYGQVAHVEFDTCDIPVRAFCQGLNAFLPVSVRVKRSWDVDNSFHARYSAMAREYRYFCKEGEGHDSFSDGLVTLLREFPSFDLLQGYASVLECALLPHLRQCVSLSHGPLPGGFHAGICKEGCFRFRVFSCPGG